MKIERKDFRELTVSELTNYGRRELLVKIAFAMVILILIILVIFGKDIMVAVTETMDEQTGSLMDQLLR